MDFYLKYHARHWKFWLFATLSSIYFGPIIFSIGLVTLSFAYWHNRLRSERVRIRVWQFSAIRDVLDKCNYPADFEYEKNLLLKKNKGPWGET